MIGLKVEMQLHETLSPGRDSGFKHSRRSKTSVYLDELIHGFPLTAAERDVERESEERKEQTQDMILL